MVFVNTEIPEEWVEAADKRDISNVEYVKRMVRAGRRQYGYEYDPAETPTQPKTLKHENKSATNIDSQLKQWILANLSTTDAQDTEDLIDLLNDELVQLADELCEEDKAKYRPSAGGYLKISKNE